MISTIETQFLSIVISIFAGLAIGILFDFYRTVNYVLKPSKVFTHFMDLLFWIVTGLVVFAILLRADYAEIRIYTFIGISIGVFIYIKLFSEYVLKFFRWTFYLVGKTFRIVIVLIIMPFKVLYNILWSPVTWLKKILSKASKGFVRVLKSPFKKKK
jgi:spore cortex biosynthesis protein YabQ